MELPSSVQKQVQLVEEIEKQLSGEQSAPQDVNQEQKQVGEEPKPTEPVENNRDEELRKLEARYKTLQGMHQADNNRFRAQLEASEKARQELAKQLEELKVKSQQNARPLVSEEEENTYGKDMLDFVRRAAQEEFNKIHPEASKLKDEVESVKKELQAQRQAKDNEVIAKFFYELDSQLPGWREQNEDPEFLAWLAEPDNQYHYRTRHSFLEEALQAGDAQTTIQIFRAFKQKKEPSKPNPLTRQIAPAHNRSTPVPENEPQKKIFSQREIKDFYDQLRRGRISGDEAQRMEEEIDRAVSEGRVSN